MPAIKPFKVIHYNPAQAELRDVVAPPYDVISPSEREELYSRHPFNAIRLILAREEDPYGSAAERFREWMKRNILISDERESLYVLSERFSMPGGGETERVGIVAACRLEDFGKGSVYPHEKTMMGPKEDRFRLFQATQAMFSQIFSLYSDPEHLLDAQLRPVLRQTPWLKTEADGVVNSVWRIEDQQRIESLREFFSHEKVFVADGHHRYETALLYRDAMRLKNQVFTGNESYSYVPMYFTNMDDPGLIILATHRIVRDLPAFSPAQLMERLGARFRLRTVDTPAALGEALSKSTAPSFGLALRDAPRFTLLQLNAHTVPDHDDLPSLLDRLDVTVLHRNILKDILGISENHQLNRRYLEYEKDAARAIDAVSAGHAQAAFLMNPTRIDQVRAVAEAGLTMPQKSTFFTPKLLSGLLIYSFA